MPFKDRHNNDDDDGDDAAAAIGSKLAAIKERQNGEKWPSAAGQDRNELQGDF